MTDHEHFVFVYGTLKRPYGNNRLLRSSVFVGTGTTVMPFWMRTTGGFPVVFRGQQAQGQPVGNIEGEIYEVNSETLRSLDGLEGHPGWYVRDQVSVDVQDTGIQQSCWMYFGDHWQNTALPVGLTSRGTYSWNPGEHDD